MRFVMPIKITKKIQTCRNYFCHEHILLDMRQKVVTFLFAIQNIFNLFESIGIRMDYSLIGGKISNFLSDTFLFLIWILIKEIMLKKVPWIHCSINGRNSRIFNIITLYRCFYNQIFIWRVDLLPMACRFHI